MLKTLSALTGLLAVLCGVSCQVENRFFRDRLHDGLEVLPISVATGVGVYGGFRITPFFGTGLGVAQTYRAGWSDGVIGEWEELNAGWVVAAMRDGPRVDRDGSGENLRFSYPVQDSERHIGGAGNFLFFIPFRFGDKSMFRQDETPAFEPVSLLDVEVNLFLGVGGVRLGLSPLQFGDWVVGWFGWDPAGDDSVEVQPDPAPVPKTPSPGSQNRAGGQASR